MKTTREGGFSVGARVALGLLMGAFALGAVEPNVQPELELVCSATNLVVTEEMKVAVKLWMPPLKDEFSATPPVMAQRPPDLQAAFWGPKWKVEILQPVDPKRIPPLETEAERNAPVFTLNDYITDGFPSLRSPFGGRDPFAGLFDDDDFFGRGLGPRKAKFPFAVRRVERHGVKGWEFTAESLPYRAMKPGVMSFPPVTARVPVITAIRTVRDRYGRATYQPTLKEARLTTGARMVTVVEPPFAGRPKSYCGAIASNLVVKAALDVNVCTAGDPLLLTLDISGATDLTAVTAPAFADVLKEGGVFRLDEGALKTETLAESRRFTWRVRPLKAGTVEFPSLPVAYYDVARRAYVTRQTASFPIQVKAGAQAALGALGEAEGDTDEFPLPDGLDLAARGAAAEPLLPHAGVALALFLLAPVLFAVIRLAPPVRRRFAAQRRATRRAAAYGVCWLALQERDPEKRARAIRTFFATRYDVNGAAVTAADARRLMAGDFTPEEIETVATALAELDRTNFAARKVVALLLMVGFAVCGAWGASPEFSYRRAGALATQAVDEAGFKAAAAAYVDCLAAGAANPVLYQNLGACALLGGDARVALAAFACAERRGGETASTRRGVRAALAQLKKDPRADLPLTRTFCAPHVRWPLDARLVATALAWALLWGLFLIPPCGLKRVLIVAVALVVLAGSVSVGVSFAGEQMAKGEIHARR